MGYHRKHLFPYRIVRNALFTLRAMKSFLLITKKPQPGRILILSHLLQLLSFSILYLKQAHLMPVLFFFLLLYIFLFHQSIRKTLKKL